MTDITIHNASDLIVEQTMPHNGNLIRLRVTSKEHKYVRLDDGTFGPATIKTDTDLSIFDLPTHITDALQVALRVGSETDVQRTEELADRIEVVMDDTIDMDVTFNDFALAIAADLLGTDAQDVYDARREEKAEREAEKRAADREDFGDHLAHLAREEAAELKAEA